MLEIIRNEKNLYDAKVLEVESTEIIDVKLSKEDIITNFKENWDLLTRMERMQFLQTYIKAIYATNEPIEKASRKRLIQVKKVEFYEN